MGKPWHPNCFTCAACAKVLTPPNFKEKNGKAYCLEDYHRLFSPKCAGCETPIADPNKQVEAMGKKWHPPCFACTVCAKPLSPYDYKENKGKPYCEDDYNKLFMPKCAACTRPITVSHNHKLTWLSSTNGKHWFDSLFVGSQSQCNGQRLASTMLSMWLLSQSLVTKQLYGKRRKTLLCWRLS